MSTDQPSIAIVVPALNEEDNIGTTVRNALSALEKLELEGEVIVVSDGSTDNTDKVVREIIDQDPRVQLLRHQSPQGIGASFLDGVDIGHGDMVVMIPGDNEVDPLEALRYYRLLEHVDIVIPFAYNTSVRSFFRNALSQTYRQIINTTFRTAFHYTNGAVLYRKAILEEFTCNSRGFFFQTEILIKAVRRGYLFAEVPYRLDPRSSGSSKATGFRSFINVCKGYIELIREVYFTDDPAVTQAPLNARSMSFERRKGRSNRKGI